MLRTFVALLALIAAVPGHAQEGVVEESFDGAAIGTHLDLETAVGRLAASDRYLRVAARHPVDAPEDLVLQVTGRRDGKGPIEVVWDLPTGVRGGEVLVLEARRLNRRKGLGVELLLGGSAGDAATVDLTDRLRMGEFERIHAAVPAGSRSVTLRVVGPRGAGVEFARLAIEPARPMRVTSAVARHVRMPVVPGHASIVGEVTVVTEGALNPLTVDRLEVSAAVPSRAVLAAGAAGFPDAVTRGEADAPFLIEGPVVLLPGRNEFQVRITTAPRKEDVRPGAEVALSLAAVIGGERVELPLGERGARTAGELVPASWLAGSEVTALALQALPIRGAPEPELFLAVEAASSDGSRIGVFRGLGSSEGAAEALTVEGRSPVLLVERGTQRVRLYFERPDAGRPSCVLSEDLGVSWGEAVEPALDGVRIGTGLRLLPGRAITVSTGGWVIPALHELQDGATSPGLLVSRDRGSTWVLSPHVPRAMTTATLAELGDGAVLADCGARGRGTRYLASTLDLGGKWSDSLTRRRPLLPCSGSSAALVHVGRDLYGVADWRLLFMNAAAGSRRPSSMTIQGSNDNGDNWNPAKAIVLDEGAGCDHPALAVVGKETVTAAYVSSEGVPVVQWIPLLDVVEKPKSLFEVFGSDRPFGR